MRLLLVAAGDRNRTLPPASAFTGWLGWLLSDVDAKHLGEIIILQNLAGGRILLPFRHTFAGMDDQILLVHIAEREEELRFFIQSRADSI